MRDQGGAGLFGQFGRRLGKISVRPEWPIQRALPHHTHFRQANAESGKQAGQRVDEDAPHAQLIGDGAAMLTAGPAKAGQRVLCGIVPAGDRDAADGLGHGFSGDGTGAGGHLFGWLAQRGAKPGKAIAHGVYVERLLSAGAKQRRE